MEIKGTGSKVSILNLPVKQSGTASNSASLCHSAQGRFLFYFFLKGCCLIDFFKTSKQLIGAQGARLLRDEWDR
jgi:hypothetical protein